MASIRRTLSPLHHGRTYENDGESFSPLSISSSSSSSSPSQKNPPQQSFSYFAKISGDSKTSRRGGWRRTLHHFLVFFLLGFLLGMTPYETLEEDSDNRFSSSSVIKRLDSVSLAAEGFDFAARKLIIVVTPTYTRAMQAYYLNRFAQTLRLVEQPVIWIVVEGDVADSFETSEILRKTGVMYRHLVCTKNGTSIKDRGVHQRNVALEHIELHKLDGVVYFGDDDNVYSLELFRSLRRIKRFGTWPVAMLAPSKNKAILEGPVCNGSQVIGWHTNEKSRRLRRFHVDMSGFAFNSTILWDPKRRRRPFSNPIRQLDTVKEGFQVTTFIEQVVADESEMEAVPSGCSRILNWHLHLDSRNVLYPRGWMIQKNLEPLITVK